MKPTWSRIPMAKSRTGGCASSVRLTGVGKKGMFITFEGPEGSGKTSQIAALADYLRQAGYPVLAHA